MKDAASAIHPAADGFSRTADNYARGRPDYPSEIAGWLRDQLGLHSGRTVVDLGAGTGKFTPRLMETGARVIAVEPVAQMLGKLSAALPQIEALAGSAESIPLPDGSVDAVVCAQSFHWFATTEALTEIHRVLKPGGRLGMVWNWRDERIGWAGKLNQLLNRFESDTPRYYKNVWRRAFPFPGFGPLLEQHFSHGHTGSPEDVVLNNLRSYSFIAALSPDEQSMIEAQVKALIAAEPELDGKEVVTVPYDTFAYYVVKIVE